MRETDSLTYPGGRAMPYARLLGGGTGAANILGTVYVVAPKASPEAGAFAVQFFLSATIVAPQTAELFVLGSSDGVYWQKIAEFYPALSATGADTQYAPLDEVPTYLCVASRITAGVATHTCRATIMGNVDFDLIAASPAPTPALTYVATTTPAADVAEKHGRLAIANPASTGNVVFAAAFTSTAYTVSLANEGAVGSADTLVWFNNRAVGGFTINLGGVPAATCTVNWRAIHD